MGNVVVLNTTQEELHKVSVPHAIRMLTRHVAVLHEFDANTTFGLFPLPKVVRLRRYVSMTWRYNHAPRWSRRGVLKRDGYICGYCGGPADTVDHVIPLSRGGERTSWLNTIAACGGRRKSCNARKANNLPEEVGMRLRFQPRVPTWAELHAAAAA